MSRQLITRTGSGGSTKSEDRCCLFCGALASDKKLIGRLNDRVCEDCLSEAGRLFSKRRFTPIFMVSEMCVSCGRTARAEVLVSGVSAAICRHCYNSIRGKKKVITIPGEDSLFPAKERMRDLKHSRAAWLRARRRYEKLHRSIETLRPSARPTRYSNLLMELAFAGRDMLPPLSLVTSKDRVQGRAALKVGDGHLAPWRLRVSTDSRSRRS
jgi:hypothetical protein